VDLVARIRENDPQALRELVLQYYARLTQFAETFLHSTEDAEDVVQEVFAKIWMTRSTWDPQSIPAYLYAAVRNRALHIIEHRKVTTRVAGELTHGHGDNSEITPDIAFEREEQRELYHELVASLTERQQTVMRLRYESGMKYSDIATVLGVSERAAQQLVARALKTLYERAREIGLSS
jgi:RNA polymerase sigma-70 factor (ECF subfamily)